MEAEPEQENFLEQILFLNSKEQVNSNKLNKSYLFSCVIEDNMFKKFVNYCKACYNELAHKTTWPTRAELTHSAMVVLSASLIIALVVFIMDFVFQNVMQLVYPS